MLFSVLHCSELIGSFQVAEAQGLVLQDLDRHAESLPILQHAWDLLPNEEVQFDVVGARMHFAIAQSALALNQPETVNRALKKSHSLGHDMGLILNVKGLLARSQNDFVKALKYLTKSIKRRPSEARYSSFVRQYYPGATHLFVFAVCFTM